MAQAEAAQGQSLQMPAPQMSAPHVPASQVLHIFAKAPVAGQCKTRLIPALGAEGAAALHQRLVHLTLATARAWQQSQAGQHTGSARVELWCAPDTAHPFFTECAQDYGVTLHQQTGADLGARMWLALCAALTRHERPVLIGTDCPWLTADDLSAAFAALGSGDAVYAPAHDGGYVLVGLSRAVPELFAGIEWGTSKVMSATRAAAKRKHASLTELRALPDVDTPADLASLKRDLARASLLEGLPA